MVVQFNVTVLELTIDEIELMTGGVMSAGSALVVAVNVADVETNPALSVDSITI